MFLLLPTVEIKVEFFEGEGDVIGDFDPATNTIRIREGDFPTLRHELFHAVMAVTGLKELVSSELEEAIATALDSFLYPTLDGLDHLKERKARKN